MTRSKPSIRHQWGLLIGATALTIAPLESAYAQNNNNQTIGGAIGGVLGGILGHEVAEKGSEKTILTAVGVIGGALIGSAIAKGLSKKDQGQLELSTQQTIATGLPQSFQNAESGVSGGTRVLSTDKRASQVQLAVAKGRVTEVPPMELMNASYRANAKTKILGGPGPKYRAVGSLNQGETVVVSGKVQDKPWYMVTQNGVGMGFVPAAALKPTTIIPPRSTAVAGEVEQHMVQVARTCRTVEQTVTPKKGKARVEKVTACQTANGWEVVPA